MASYSLPLPEDVERARQLLDTKVIRTPVQTSQYLDHVASTNLRRANRQFMPERKLKLFLKCENLQKTGSFKFRGASHFLSKLSDTELANGVVTYSTGNHAQAVAHAAQTSSQVRGIPIPAYVVVPEDCPTKKVSAARSYGATVSFAGLAPEDRVRLAQQIQQSTGAILVPPADHRDIVLGQATAVHELLEQVEEQDEHLDAVIVPSGGGGLLVGAIAVCKPRNVAVFAAEPEQGGPGLAKAMRLGRRAIKLEEPLSIADGLRSLTGAANWEHIRQEGNVDGVCPVTEKQIKQMLGVAVKELGFVIEPSAAVALAVPVYSHLFFEALARFGEKVNVGIVLSGGNVGLEDLRKIVFDLGLEDGVECAHASAPP